jgi:hypothetical protein
MGRSQGQESGQYEDDIWSDDADRASGNVKHMSAVTCIRAAGESLTPFIVPSQDSQSVRRKLVRRGVRLGIDLVLRERPKPYGNEALFLEDIHSIFILYLHELRDSEQFDVCEAVLLMDNCSPHISDDVIPVLTNARVRTITFAPHMTHVFQMLDVVLFAVLKKHATDRHKIAFLTCARPKFLTRDRFGFFSMDMRGNEIW